MIAFSKSLDEESDMKFQCPRGKDETKSDPMQLCVPVGGMLVLLHRFRLPFPDLEERKR